MIADTVALRSPLRSVQNFTEDGGTSPLQRLSDSVAESQLQLPCNEIFVNYTLGLIRRKIRLCVVVVVVVFFFTFVVVSRCSNLPRKPSLRDNRIIKTACSFHSNE